MTRPFQWQRHIERIKFHLQLHSFGAKLAWMLVKRQSTLLSARKQSGSQELENSGGALVCRLELAWRLWHSGMVAPCPHFSRSPRASKRNRTVKYGSGMPGEAYFTPISKGVFRVI